MTNNIIQSFKQWLMEDGRAETTIQSYMNDVEKFQRYLIERQVDPEILFSRFYFTSYVKQLHHDGMKVNTINKKINSLKVYNDWLSVFVNIVVASSYLTFLLKSKSVQFKSPVQT